MRGKNEEAGCVNLFMTPWSYGSSTATKGTMPGQNNIAVVADDCDVCIVLLTTDSLPEAQQKPWYVKSCMCIVGYDRSFRYCRCLL